MKRTMLFSSALLALTLLHAPAFAASPANLEPVLAAHRWLNGHLTGRRQLSWPVDDNYLGRLRA